MNEFLFILTIILYFGALLLCKRLWGRLGLFIWIVIGTMFANVELNKMVTIFGLEMTLGNVLFSSTFLCTDVLSECYSKEDSKLAVYLGAFASIALLVISQIALAFTPSATDTLQPHLLAVFGQIPRIAIASFVVYYIVQRVDVFLYHKIWEFTEKKSGSKDKYLWVRNNVATLISQLLNNSLFAILVWTGVYSFGTILSIIISSYALSIILALIDTPFVYLARKVKCRKEII